MNIIVQITIIFIMSLSNPLGAAKGGLPESTDVSYERSVLVVTIHKTQWQLFRRVGQSAVLNH